MDCAWNLRKKSGSPEFWVVKGPGPADGSLLSAIAAVIERQPALGLQFEAHSNSITVRWAGAATATTVHAAILEAHAGILDVAEEATRQRAADAAAVLAAFEAAVESQRAVDAADALSAAAAAAAVATAADLEARAPVSATDALPTPTSHVRKDRARILVEEPGELGGYSGEDLVLTDHAMLRLQQRRIPFGDAVRGAKSVFDEIKAVVRRNPVTMERELITAFARSSLERVLVAAPAKSIGAIMGVGGHGINALRARFPGVRFEIPRGPHSDIMVEIELRGDSKALCAAAKAGLLEMLRLIANGVQMTLEPADEYAVITIKKIDVATVYAALADGIFAALGVRREGDRIYAQNDHTQPAAEVVQAGKRLIKVLVRRTADGKLLNAAIDAVGRFFPDPAAL